MPKITAASWKKAAVHEGVVLPSGTEVSIKIPNLPELIKQEKLPNSLIDVAIEVTGGNEKVTRDHIKQQADFYNAIVAITVVDPEINSEDVPDLPPEDIEMIAELATRQRDLDALGHHIGGLHTNADFRKFRGLSYGDEDVASV